MKDFTSALTQEIKLRKDFFSSDTNITTVYFGGGTPSLLDNNLLDIILDNLTRTFSLAHDAEITLEANPEDLSSSKLKFLKQIGVNRMSIGIQSFNDVDLQYLGRSHNGNLAYNRLMDTLNTGFTNTNIDLIYGIPTLGEKDWVLNLEKMRASGVTHVSCYQLTIEDKTPLKLFINKGKALLPNEAQVISHYHTLSAFMGANQFAHYEISNFAKDGYMSQHNLTYWQGGYYLGLGPAAHSYDGKKRCWNVANTSLYIQNLLAEKKVWACETLDKNTKFNEYIFLSLRTKWGCKWDIINTHFGTSYVAHLKKVLKSLSSRGVFNISDDGFNLNKEGFLFADGIAAELFML